MAESKLTQFQGSGDVNPSLVKWKEAENQAVILSHAGELNKVMAGVCGIKEDQIDKVTVTRDTVYVHFHVGKETRVWSVAR